MILPGALCTARSVRLVVTSFIQLSSRGLVTGEKVVNDAQAARKAKWNRTKKEASFVDIISMDVEAGQGGDGCVAFAREKYNPFGPPSGAAGGQGGSIYVKASLQVNTLARLPHHLTADRGGHGSGDWQAGKKAADKVIDVPVGTIVRIRHRDREDEGKILKEEYESLLISRYRGAYMRARRISRNRIADGHRNVSAFSPSQLRAQRDAVWRYYAGAIGHNAQDQPQESDGFDEDLERLGNYQSLQDLNDAESDIRPLGRSFRSAERRLAFALIESEVERSSRQASSIGDGKGEEVTFDLAVATEQPVCIVQGGQGGFGNAFFASSENRSPAMATRGRDGQEATVVLDWKFKGDVGLIGLPNAGKSTFMKAVCATGDSVRVADYAFTTLTPNVGVVRLGESGLLGLKRDADVALPSTTEEDEEARFVLQDLPGLVRGASDNRGLGHEFLKHVERCHALYYVVDVSDQSPSPWEDVGCVFQELELHREGLSAKVKGVIANKCDAINAEQAEGAIDKIDRLREETAALHGRTVPVWNTSAKLGLGVEQAARAMSFEVREARSGKMLEWSPKL